MNIFTRFKAYLQLRDAINTADKAHAENGQRFYVVAAGNRKLLVLCRSDLKQLRLKHWVHHTTNVHSLISECFYHTPHRNGNGAMSPSEFKIRKSLYYQWYAHNK